MQIQAGMWSFGAKRGYGRKTLQGVTREKEASMTMFLQKTKAGLQELLHAQATWREIIRSAEGVA